MASEQRVDFPIPGRVPDLRNGRPRIEERGDRLG